MDWSDRIDLAEALLGLPGKHPGKYEDVTKLARIGTLIGLGVGFLLGAEGGRLLGFCLAIFAGSLLGGAIGLYIRRPGADCAAVRLNRKIEIARSVGCALMAGFCFLASILKANILTIFGIFFFGWLAVRYFHRQQILTGYSESSGRET